MTTTEKTIVLVTGANTGIGWETVKSLLQSSRVYHILLGTRILESGEEALAALKRTCRDEQHRRATRSRSYQRRLD